MSKMSLRFYLSLLVVYMLPGVLYAQHGDSYYTVGATIDGLKYNLNEQTHTAMVASHNSWEGELAIPEEIVYEGESYVTGGNSLECFQQLYDSDESENT